MKTYAQYEAEEFINEIDTAMTKLNSLEARAGKPQSEFQSDINAINRRIYEMQYGSTASNPLTTSKGATGGDLTALKARHRELCGYLGIEPRFQVECKTAAEYQTQITRLEARLKAGKVEGAPASAVPAKPFNATVAFYKSGKAKGLAKACGAAAERAA